MQESGVLRTRDIVHRKKGSTLGEQNPAQYFIEDKIEYSVKIDQKVKGQWRPYVTKSLQM